MTFADKVKKIIKKIPKGKVRTYKEVAALAGNARAARAVGNICKSNSDKTIPCHRVIRSDGKIGDYNGLQGRSKKLILEKEGYKIGI